MYQIMKTNKHHFFILFLFSLPYVISGQLPFYNPQIFHTDKNLPQTYIDNIVQDDSGFLWISGKNGVQRFDGSHFKIFKHDPKDSTTIAGNDTRGIFFDNETNKLWIPTRASGLSVMDLNSGKCKNYYHHPDRPSKLPNSRMLLAFKDREKNIWVSVNNHGILKYQPETDDFKKYKYQIKEENTAGNLENMTNLIQSYAEDLEQDSILWFGTLAGLLKFNKVTGEFERFVFENKNVSINSINHILHIHPHPNGKIYLGTYLGGIVIFNPKTKSFKHATIHGRTLVKKQGENDIRGFHPKSENELWITCRTGIGIFDTDLDQSTFYLENDFQKEEAYGIRFVDNQGRFYTWGLFYKGGNKPNKDYLFSFDPTRHQVVHYPFQPTNDRRYFWTKSMVEEKGTNTIWAAGIFSDGLYRVELATGKWIHYALPKGYFDNRQSFQAYQILRLKSGELLVVADEAIYQVDEIKKQLIPYHLQPQLKDASFRSILQDANEQIWVGTYYGGLVRIDPNLQSIKYFKKELNPPDMENHASAIWTMAVDRKNNVWFRASKGFSVFNAEKEVFHHFPYIYSDSKERVGIQSMITDTKGRVCMNTEYFQVIGITNPDHPEKGIVRFLDKTTGIKIEQPLAFTCDENGDIWQANKDLEKINLDDQTSVKFAGAYGKEGNIWSLGKMSDGRILVGYKQGIGVFHPNDLNTNIEIPQPYLTSFKVFDKELKLETSLYKIKSINLHPDQNFFSFNFSALGYTFPKDIQFKYKLEGFNDDWIQPKDRRYAAYTNVPFGDYILKITAANNEEVWNKHPIEIGIHISTPWYRSWWAYLLYISTLSIGFYAAYIFIKRRRELRFQLEKEKAEAEKLKEIDNFKNTFFTNITHEFRTPLTIIQGMAGELKGNENAKQLIQNNSHQLLELVNQLLDLSKIDSGNLSMNWEQRDIINYINYITESLQTFAFSKKISLAFHSELENLNMDFDPEKLQTILINLISNAIKFTPEYGKIILIGTKKMIDDQAYFTLKISDNGIGISPSTLPFIFDRYFQEKNSNTLGVQGSGIGLALVKELTEMHQATIEVKSIEQKGTTFTLTFPIHQNAILVTNSLPSIKQSIATKSEISIEKKRHTISNDNSQKLLIIEDNYDVIQYLMTILKNKYEISIAKNGSAGIDKALLEIPDIIISDVMMPEKNGFEVCTTLKQDERTSHIPIILLTAKATTKDKIEGLQFGADAYLMKPFDKEELLVRLEKLLELRKKLQVRFGQFSSSENKSSLSIEDKFLQKLNKTIDANLMQEDFTTPFLCKKMGMSNSQLYRKLKAVTGFSIANYIRYRRLLNAHQMIESSNEQISDIAFQSGFSNLSWFSQSFKETFGYSPNELRK